VVERLPAPLREGPLQVTDLATGEKAAYEAVPGTRRHLLIFAKDVPAVGYKTYRIEKAQQAMDPGTRPFPLELSWNSSGWITSIREARTGRELIPPEKQKPIGRVLVSQDRDDFRPDETGPARISVQDGPVTRRIEMIREGSVLPLTAVTLYRDAAYADLRFDVDLGLLRDSTGGNLRYAISLPFAAETTFIDGAGFAARLPEDVLPGGGAPQSSPVQFVHYRRQSDWGATVANIDAALVRPDQSFLLAADSLASSTREEGLVRLFRTEPRSSPVQSFRFRIAIQEEDAAEWKRFGAEANVPLKAVVGSGTPDSPQRGLLELSDRRIHLLAFKPAEFQPGLHVIRLQESSGTAVKGVALRSPLKLVKAEAADLVEESLGKSADLGNLSFSPWETKTILVQAGRPDGTR